MYYTANRIPSTYSSNNNNNNTTLQRVHQVSARDGEKLSPVDLAISRATVVQLPPLDWAHYHLTPSNMTVRNSGFTVMINATYNGETPFVSSGPLMGNYVFSQIHFHWGEHNETGSGHAVDGSRYPLEMHVVHLRKDCATLGEAFESKDGIAVMVHLFALREERNTQLDQLTAILQFIQKPKCCARLYPIPLDEIVHPFSSDYFLYWGAVGSPRGQYRILWLVSRNVLPVSTHQLEEFRQLRDPQGKALVSNSSKPQPLAGRSLFLVSPSGRTDETMYGVRQQVQEPQALDSEDSIDIGNAEYKSLAALDDIDHNSCRICPAPTRLKHIANINVGYPFKVNEGDTSVEESCVDLGNNVNDSGVTVKTEMKYKDDPKGQKVITNVNVTTCRHKHRPKYTPSEAVYSVISTKGSELHLKRKPLFVRPNDPSTEQACMLLSNRSSTHPTYSAPSLTTSGGFLTIKQEHTDLSNPPCTNFSSELAVHLRDSECEANPGRGNVVPARKARPEPPVYQSFMSEVQKESNFEETLKSSKKTKKVRIQGYNDVDNLYNETPYIPVSETPQIGSLNLPVALKQDIKTYDNQPYPKTKEYGEYCEEEEQDISREEEHTKYLLVKEMKNQKPFYKVVGELPTGYDSNQGILENNINLRNNKGSTQKHTCNNSVYIKEEELIKNDRHDDQNKKNIQSIKHDLKPYEREGESDPNEYLYQNIYQNESLEEKNQKETLREVHVKQNNPLPSTSQKSEAARNKDKDIQPQPTKKTKGPNTHQEPESDPHYRVSLVVRTTVSDHRKPGQKKLVAAHKYVVTKISPVERLSYLTPKPSDTDAKKCFGKKRTTEDIEHLYYARPAPEDKQIYPELPGTPQRSKAVKEQGFTSEYYEESIEDIHKQHKKVGHLTIITNQNNVTNENKQTKHSQERNANIDAHTPQDPGMQEQNIYDEELYENKKSVHQHETVHYKLNKNSKQLPTPQLNEPTSEKYLAIPESRPKEITQNSIDSNKAVYEERSKNANLIQKINVYQGRNDPDEDVRIIDKTITGKMGESQSTEVFVKGQHVEVVSPKKTSVTKEINYNLLRSKHPEPQYYVKEPENKTQPKSIIRQHLSLDQQIKGHCQVNQTVEYHDRTRPNTNNQDPSGKTSLEKPQHLTGKTTSNNITEIYEESNHEQSSTFQKFQQQTRKQFQPSQPTNEDIDPVDKAQVFSINSLNKEQNIDQEKNGNFFPTIDPKCKLPSTYISPKTEKSLARKSSRALVPSKGIPQNINDSNDPAVNQQIEGNTNLLPNTGYSSFEYEETSSVKKSLEHSKHEKTLKYHIQAAESKDNLDPTNTINTRLPLKHEGRIEIIPSVTKHELTERRNKHVTETDPTALHKLNNIDNERVEFEEILEENVIETSQKTREKKVTAKVRGDTTYKFPSPAPTETSKPESQHTLVIKKVEVTEPHYVTRVPKQPLVEYEAFPVNPQQPFEIVTETLEEMSSVIKTNKTFMMFKRINGKAVLNQPSIIEPMRVEVNNSKENPLSPNSSMKNKNIMSFEKTQLNKSDQIAAPYVYDEEYLLHENLNEKEKKTSMKRIQIQPYNTTAVDPYKYLPGINEEEKNVIEKLPGDNIVQVEKSPQKSKDPEQISFETNHTKPITKRRPQNNFTEYEYSETSLISEQRFTQKEKKYRYKIKQSPLYEEDNVKPLTDNENPATNFGFDPSEDDDYNDPNTNSKFLDQRTELETDKKENKTKIIVGSHHKQNVLLDRPQPIIYVDNEIPREEDKSNHRNHPILKTNTAYSQPGFYIDEEYYESSMVDQKHKSEKKHIVSPRGGPAIAGQSQPGPSHQYPPYLQDPSRTYLTNDPKYPEIHDKPTKDTPSIKRVESNPNEEGGVFKIESLSKDYESSKQKSLVYQLQYANEREATGVEEKSTPYVIKNLNSGTIPITKTDGDIVIYIRQPRIKKDHISPKITVDVSDQHPMTPSELENQTVQVHEIKPVSKKQNTARKPILPRKSKSADIYRPSQSSGTSEDEEGSNLNTDSNEEQVLDTTHYNLTLKSETQVEMPSGQNANVRSKAEVKITPLSKPGTPTKPRGVQEENPTTDECCSDIRITEIQDDTQSTSMDEQPERVDSSGNQSPIRINTESSVVKRCPKLLFFNHWDAQGNALLENNGKTLRGSYLEDSMLPYLQGGPVEGVYIFSELHFHWGHKDCCGAEHIIDGQRSTLEAHYLYTKKEYGSLKNAMNHTDGLVVVAVNLIVGGPPNSMLEELIKDMPLLREANTGTYVPAEYLFSWVKPTIDRARGYYSYKGSLTLYPPYVEAVTWLIFPEPILFCCQQGFCCCNSGITTEERVETWLQELGPGGHNIIQETNCS